MLRTLVLVFMAALGHAACPDGQWEVSLRNSGTVYCVGGQPCSGKFSAGMTPSKYFCPQQGQLNAAGDTELTEQTCCGVMSGDIMGCVVKTPDIQCVGPLPLPYTTKTPVPTTGSITTAPVTTAPVTTAPSTLPPNSTKTPTTTTLSPNATTESPTTIAPNSTLSPNATTLSPDATTSPTDATSSPGTTTLPPDSQKTATPSNPGSADNNSKNDGGGLGTGATVGIIFGCIAALALLVALFILRKKRESPAYLESPAAGEEMITPGEGGADTLTPRQHVTLL